MLTVLRIMSWLSGGVQDGERGCGGAVGIERPYEPAIEGSRRTQYRGLCAQHVNPRQPDLCIAGGNQPRQIADREPQFAVLHQVSQGARQLQCDLLRLDEGLLEIIRRREEGILRPTHRGDAESAEDDANDTTHISWPRWDRVAPPDAPDKVRRSDRRRRRR